MDEIFGSGPASDAERDGRVSRRRFLTRSLALAGGLTLAGGLLTACGGGAPAPAKPVAEPTRPGAPAPTNAPAAAAATVAPAAKPAAAGPRGTVTVIQGPEITHLDATLETGMVTFNPAIHIFDTLTFRDEKSTIQPMLATAWSYPDPRTIRLKVRSGVKFHNGDPLTVDDVVATYQRVIVPANNSKHITYVKTIDAVQKVDDETVDFKLKAPDATLLGRFSLIPIVPRKVYESLGPEGFNGKPVGSGPWIFQEWVKGQRVVMEANPNYWRGAPKIKTLVFRNITEDNTRVTELLTGNADVVTNVPPELAERVKSNPKAVVQQIQSLRNIHVRVNAKKAPFNDVRVRQALNHAIDVNLLISTILGGAGVPTPGGVMGPGVWGHYAGYAKGYEYDPAKAKRLLAEAGVPSNFKTTVQSAQGRLLGDREIAQAVAGMLQQVGINAEVQLMDYDYILNEFSRKYNEAVNLQLTSNANNTADADYNYSLNFLSTNRGLYWSTPDVDGLINKARETLEVEPRQKVYQELGARMVQEAPVIFLYDQVDTYGASKRLQNFKARADELMYLYEASVAE